jgi:hypothetical protein
MIISKTLDFVFVKTRKTAGTSIEIALSRGASDNDIITPISTEDEIIRATSGGRGPQNIPGNLYSHSSIVDALEALGEERSHQYFTFCVERNPFDRALSLYYWRMRGSANPSNINSFIQEVPKDRLSNWHLYSDGNSVLVDKVLRFEQLQLDLNRISARIGWPNGISLSKIKAKSGLRPSNSNARDMLDKQSIKLIEQVCYREIELFGYRPY